MHSNITIGLNAHKLNPGVWSPSTFTATGYTVEVSFIRSGKPRAAGV